MARLVVLFSLLCALLGGCGSLEAISITSTQSSPGPTGLAVIETSPASVKLSWSPVQGDVAAYKIYRNGVLVGTNGREALNVPAATTFVDRGLSPSTTYSYMITTINTLGVEFARSEVIWAGTLVAGSSAGYPPDGLAVTQTTTSSVTITWGAATSQDGKPLVYRIYRNSAFVGSATVASGSEGSYTDTNLTPATTYSYKVSLASESSPSIQVTATTQASAAATQTAVSTLAGSAGLRGGWSDATGLAASFSAPYGITSDGSSLYVADSSSHTIRKIEIATGAVSTIAGSPGVSGSADGAGSAARFNMPRGLATDRTSLWVADSGNHAIRKINLATREVTTVAGKAGLRGYVNGSGSDARFHTPRGVATDGGYLYITDTYNSAIRKIDIATGVVSTLAGSPGSHGSNDGRGGGASFYYPYGLATDGNNIYVSDTCNFTIRKISIASGDVSTIAGLAGRYGSSDGTGTDASFYYPDGLTTDGAYVYVTDTSNHTVRLINLATMNVTTLAGQAGTHGTADGSGGVARFYSPRGVTISGRSAYLTDTSNNTLRKIALDDVLARSAQGAARVSP